MMSRRTALAATFVLFAIAGACGRDNEELWPPGVVPRTQPTIAHPSATPNACAPSKATSNDVDPLLLAPAILDDRAEIEAYLAALPKHYREYTVPTIGTFYLDDTDDVIKGILRKGMVWEQNIIDVLASHVKPGTTVIDAGAHIGTHAISISKLVGPSGRVFAFEPQRKLFRELVYNLKRNAITNVVPLRFALGDHAGVVEMMPAVAGNEGGTGVGAGGDKAELRTIDAFPFKHVSVMKIDVEGFEDHVLDGAQLTIARWRPVIIVEIQGGHDYETAPPEIKAKVDVTKAKLTALGYDVSRISVHDYLGIPKRR